MRKVSLPELLKTQISLTEWFDDIDHKQTEEMRVEDNEKRPRLKILNELINLPFDEPHYFLATNILNSSPAFQRFFQKHQNELCAFRLLPTEPKLPKLRMRGLTITKALDWFKEQNIDFKKYKVEIIPHSDNPLWSTIFVVNTNGIYGEIIKGLPYLLTQGFRDKKQEPISFHFDFKKWHLSRTNNQALTHLKKLTSLIKVTDISLQKKIQKKLKATFVNDYLVGYFETVEVKEFGIWFIDYNRILGNLYSDFSTNIDTKKSDSSILRGNIGSSGKVTGKARIIIDNDLSNLSLESGEILICPITTPNHLPLMRQATAIITDMGGILSHAAIVSRELKIPCLTAAKNATTLLQNGDLIEVDATLGTITKLS